jgi:hypothetical protein
MRRLGVGDFGNLLMFGQGGFLDHAEVLPRLRELNPTPARPRWRRRNNARYQEVVTTGRRASARQSSGRSPIRTKANCRLM